MVTILPEPCQIIHILFFNLLLYNFTIKHRSPDGQNRFIGKKYRSYGFQGGRNRHGREGMSSKVRKTKRAPGDGFSP